jgi:hypothetical protein
MNVQQGRTGPGTPPLARVAVVAVVLEIILSIGALGGGLVLMIAPRGEIMPLPLSALAGSPFDTYLVPGVILFGVLGLGGGAAGRSSRPAWRGSDIRSPRPPPSSLALPCSSGSPLKSRSSGTATSLRSKPSTRSSVW